MDSQAVVAGGQEDAVCGVAGQLAQVEAFHVASPFSLWHRVSTITEVGVLPVVCEELRQI